MVGILMTFCFFAIPASMLAFFGICLYRYLSAKRHNKQTPGKFSPEEIKKRNILLIISSIVAGASLAVVIGFLALLYMAIAFM